MVTLNLADIQGFILRGYKMPALRQFVLRINDAAAARQFIGGVVSGDVLASPQITNAVDWGDNKPDYALNIGFSYEGLKAIQLPQDALQSFPAEFRAGAVARAEEVGDTGDNAPEHWKAELASADFHVLLTLFAKDAVVVETISSQLRDLFQQRNRLSELCCLDGGMLPGMVGHFGYADGFSQPTIEGAPPSGFADPLPLVPPGEFLLGYPSQFRGWTYPVPTPQPLGLNGSFMVLRVLKQDVHGFETFLDEKSRELGMDKELLAAKVCGRWRNGVPLALSPDDAPPAVPIKPGELNFFDYKPTEQYPRGYNDARGFRCPIGSHIRRVNPRSATIAGSGGNLRRLARRGLPYGPPYDPAHPNDGQERGLLGMFICVSVKDQFEFVMSEWVNDGLFAGGLGRTKCPMLGDNTPQESKFVIPVEGSSPHVIKGFSRFVTTMGSAYCFLPGISALRFMAALP